MLESRPGLKKFLRYLLIHPCTACLRWQTRTFAILLVIKKGEGSIVRRKVRLNVIPSEKIAVGVKNIIEDYIIINNGMGNVTIGGYTHVTSHVKLAGPITSSSYVTLDSDVQVTRLIRNYLDVTCPIVKQDITPNCIIVEDGVWIGSNSCINQGITIGTYCIAAAGSVVIKSVPSYSAVGGNPARILKLYDFEKREWIRTSRK